MLLLGAILNFILAVGHLICLFFLDVAFKFYGIDGMMDEIASHGACLPYIITIIIAGCFALGGFYALSGAGKIRRLPLLWLGIFFVAFVFWGRAFFGIYGVYAEAKTGFPVYSSIVVASVIGFLYFIGGIVKISKKSFGK